MVAILSLGWERSLAAIFLLLLFLFVLTLDVRSFGLRLRFFSKCLTAIRHVGKLCRDGSSRSAYSDTESGFLPPAGGDRLGDRGNLPRPSSSLADAPAVPRRAQFLPSVPKFDRATIRRANRLCWDWLVVASRVKMKSAFPVSVPGLEMRTALWSAASAIPPTARFEVFFLIFIFIYYFFSFPLSRMMIVHDQDVS